MNSIKKFFDSIIYYEYQKNKTYHYIGKNPDLTDDQSEVLV